MKDRRTTVYNIDENIGKGGYQLSFTNKKKENEKKGKKKRGWLAQVNT